MGVCCSSFEPVAQVALKFPGGTKAVGWGNRFIPCDINEWIKSVSHVSKPWTGWVCYNDETKLLGIHQTRKGHCKGIVAWNDDRISWLIHSVPNFPRVFTGTTISELEPSEHIYGQSFVNILTHYNPSLLNSILSQISHMQAHVFIQYGTIPVFPKSNRITTIPLFDDVAHIAKPPSVKIDIYGHLAETHPRPWYVQSWKRGHPIAYTGIHDIQTMRCDTTEWSGSQDHSKWAVSDDLVWIGDLNRMSSQENRGGGGVIIRDAELAQSMKDLARTWIEGRV
jgi:hypothetical protein